MAIAAMAGACAPAAPAKHAPRPAWSSAPADPSSPRLLRGEVAVQQVRDDAADRLGGAASLLVNAPSFVVMAALERPEAYWHVLPRVLEVEEQPSDDRDQVLRITHGKGLLRGSYVVRVRREWGERGRHLIRFWIDTRYPRVVKDAWGYFEMRPVGTTQTLLTYQVRAELKPGVLRMLFANRIQHALMLVPQRARLYVQWCREQSATEAHHLDTAESRHTP